MLVEGGGHVHASLLARGLADELVIYVAPTVVGGPAPSWVGGQGVGTLAAAYGFEHDNLPILLGEDLKLTLVRKIR